ncbi:MAG: glycosyltransferase family 2 protein, partial [Desulfovibrio sp.]|nr:glycosyltransferase family 2 protein [Desulfovibrio sp.]
MDVSIIYVNWNAADEIAASIESVRNTVAGVAYEIIVVDNNSPESCDVLDQEDVVLIRNPVNAGFGAGCNLGVSRSRGRHLLFLNPDTRLRNDILSCLSRFLDEHPTAGACGPMVLREDGSIDYGAARANLTVFNEFLEHSTLAFRFPRSKILGRPYYSYWDHQSTRTVDSLLGACMLFRRDLFQQLGGFDERFFLYAEEVDLCKRTWDAGFEIYYVHTC